MGQKLVLAVSGGVDSIVLLDLVCKRKEDAIVVHVDHGIRPHSDDDAAFVSALCSRYGIPCIVKRLTLGADASEEVARQARYEALFAIAEQADGIVVTAHHRDDLVGSVAINLTRGTGWRGLAVMNRSGIVRPLLGQTKSQLYAYALRHRLEWVEDETNQSPQYLRNRLRAGVLSLSDEAARTIKHLRDVQVGLSTEIISELDVVGELARQSRYFFTNVDESVGVELLGALLRKQVGMSFTQPALKRALLAIKTAKSNTFHDIGSGVRLSLKRYSFVVETEN